MVKLIDTTTLWLICLSVATPIAGIVGFAVQLRTVKKIRLENEKLSLEILTLRKAQELSERRLVTVSSEEVIKYNDASFSRRKIEDSNENISNSSLINSAKNSMLIIVFLIVAIYLMFDIYRLIAWLYSFINQTFKIV